MKTEIETLAGETPGIAYELVVHRLAGSDPAAPRVYIQAALHADERPGPAALHYLIPELVKAEAEGRLRGSLTLVPQAKPGGRRPAHVQPAHGPVLDRQPGQFQPGFPGSGC